MDYLQYRGVATNFTETFKIVLNLVINGLPSIYIDATGDKATVIKF